MKKLLLTAALLVLALGLLSGGTARADGGYTLCLHGLSSVSMNNKTTYELPVGSVSGIFLGWAESENGLPVYAAGQKITLSGDTDLYAVSCPTCKIAATDPDNGGSLYLGGILWHVIGTDAKSKNQLLISEVVLGGKMTWANANQYCDTVYDGFSGPETDAVKTVDIADADFRSWEASDIIGVDVFMLSAPEALTYLRSNLDHIQPPSKWWLRSPDKDDPDAYKAAVNYEGGTLVSFLANNGGTLGARPAFVLDRKRALFESAAENDKPEADGGFHPFTTPSSKVIRKLTLIDDARRYFSASLASYLDIALPGRPLTVNYADADTGANEYVSAMLCDTNGNPLYYASTVSEGSGTWELTMPSNLTVGSSYTLKVFNEQRNGNDETDYSSEMQSITVTAANGYAVDLTASPETGGMVLYAGNYAANTLAAVSAIPARDYRFVNWTENGVIVSSNADYSFTVTSDRSLVAHFEPVYDGGGTQADPWVVNRDHSDIVWKSGWYKVPSDYTLSSRVTVTGDVHLILGESATLTAMKGINVSGDRSLTVSGTGALNVGADANNAAIGGNSGQSAGTIVIDGGVLTVNAGNYASGIGGGNQGGAGNITINGGTVNIQFAGSSSGIGTGKEGRGGSVTINGGTVNAKGRFGAGIGGGDKAPGIAVSITGGTVVAQSYNGGAGIGGGPYRNGGSVTISGGQITAIGSVYPDTGQGAPGIGSGRPQTSGSTQLNGGTCEITGGTVIAIAGNTNEGNGAQAIGANYQDIAASPANAGTLTIGDGLMVTAGDSESTAVKVATDDRVSACRSGYARIEPDHDEFFGTPDFTLPQNLTTIKESAFENVTAMTIVDAGSVISIGANAFKGCVNLSQIRLSKDCIIDETAFTGCGIVFVFAPKGGATQSSCAAIPTCVFVAETQD